MSADDCVFCDLMASGQAQWIVSDGPAVAFLPLLEGSLAPGHTLVAPRVHCVGVQDADPQALHAVIDLVQRLSRAMESVLGAGGVVVLNASGANSGQSVDHLHFHVVPCWPDDQATFWPGDRSSHVVPGEPHLLLADALR